ncbi:MAG: glycosyltransferase family 2 protein [bacterium]
MENLSIVIPTYNEAGNTHLLWEKITDVMRKNSFTYEIIFVDDGSSDLTFGTLQELSKKDKHIKVIRLARNFGQTAALSAGFDNAQNELIITLDADLQNDPEDIPLLISELRKGFDVVSGWRKNRQDNLLRRIPSFFGNLIISKVTGVSLKDYGCTLKVYKRIFIEKLGLYGEMHRFLPAYLFLLGAKITEMPVNHHSRGWGKSKYGIGRTFKVLLDLFTAKFFVSYLTKPIYIFGGTGLVVLFLGILVGMFVLYQKYFLHIWVHRNPLLLLAMFLGILGIQFIAMGLIAEIVMRSYFESKGERPYMISEKINF